MGQPTDYNGAEFLYSPEQSGSATLFYDREITGNLAFFANLNAHYQSSSNGDLGGTNAGQIDSYSLLNGSIGIHTMDQRWELSLWGNNLTDEYYWLSVTQNANAVIRFAGKSRTYGTTLSYRF